MVRTLPPFFISPQVRAFHRTPFLIFIILGFAIRKPSLRKSNDPMPDFKFSCYIGFELCLDISTRLDLPSPLFAHSNFDIGFFPSFFSASMPSGRWANDLNHVSQILETFVCMPDNTAPGTREQNGK